VRYVSLRLSHRVDIEIASRRLPASFTSAQACLVVTHRAGAGIAPLDALQILQDVVTIVGGNLRPHQDYMPSFMESLHANQGIATRSAHVVPGCNEAPHLARPNETRLDQRAPLIEVRLHWTTHLGVCATYTTSERMLIILSNYIDMTH
jgi:hypothetical protein